ncbi:MAG: glutaredoxin family protein [Gammaproteobacteria bacterium]|nr:glutaredoxin family protein [Gammaproteobacteria bacterium]
MRTSFASLVFAALLLAAPASAGEVYKWKDKYGRIHFGDRPPAGAQAEEVEVKVRSIVEAPTVSAYSNLPVNIAVSEPVIMYGAEWCGVCQRAKTYMRAKGIPFREYDIEKDPTGRRHYRQLNGTGVPIILVGNQRMNGFSPARLEAMLAKPQ